MEKTGGYYNVEYWYGEEFIERMFIIGDETKILETIKSRHVNPNKVTINKIEKVLGY